MTFYYKGQALELPLSDETREMLINRGKDPLVAQCDRAWANIKANQDVVNAQAESEDSEEVEVVEGYDKLKKAELVEEINVRNTESREQGYDDEPISTEGTKPELIARLEEFDRRHPEAPTE